jgi:hypothetical protein
MTLIKAESTESRRTWIKPEFEVLDLCCEVTLYLYNR